MIGSLTVVPTTPLDEVINGCPIGGSGGHSTFAQQGKERKKKKNNKSLIVVRLPLSVLLDQTGGRNDLYTFHFLYLYPCSQIDYEICKTDLNFSDTRLPITISEDS